MKKILPFICLFLSSILLNAQTGDYALQFDGDGDYVSIPDNANIDFTSSTSYTIEAWIYADTLATSSYGRAVLSKFNASDNSYWIRVNSNGKVFFDGVYTSDDVITIKKWYHVACVYKAGTGTYRKIYVNGVDRTAGNETMSGPNDGNAEPLKIGRHTNLANDWKGRIDEIRLWNVERSADEIRANMYKEIGTHTNLKAYYKMSDGTGVSLTDNSGNINTGTFNGDIAWKISGCFFGSRKALIFDGSNEYVEFETDPPYNHNSLTIEAWIKSTSSAAEREIVCWTNPSSNVAEFRMSEGKLQFGIDVDGWNSVISTTPINTGNWTHVAMVKDGTNIKLYVNGYEDASGTILDNLTNVSQMQIANLIKNTVQQTYYFPGTIDEVKIWNTVRTPEQIKSDLIANAAGSESGLVAYYRFDQYENGTNLYDLSGNGYIGTLINMESGDWVTDSPYNNVWVGNVSSAWGTPGNWINGIPATTDNVAIYKVPLDGSYDINIPSNFTVNNLIVSSSASPTLPATFTVNGSFITQKDIDITGKTITLGSSGYLTEGTSRLYGTSGTISTSRSLGTLSNLTNIGGLGFEVKSTADLGTTVVTRGVTAQVSDGLDDAIKRYYDVTSTGGGTIDVSFHYNDAEVTGLESNLSLFKSTNSGTTWTKISDTRDNTANTVSAIGLTSFSRFTLANGTSPLPVELQALSASIQNNQVELTWETVTEINNYGFEIERAQIIKNETAPYSTIGFVQGHGNSNNGIMYKYSDTEYLLGKYSYRLKQIDNDGKFTYSNSIEVEINNITTFDLFQNYPNPFNPTTTISYQVPDNCKVTLKVFDVLGKEVTTLVDEYKQSGKYNVQFNAKDLASGMYIYQINAGNFVSSKKLMIMK